MFRHLFALLALAAATSTAANLPDDTTRVYRIPDVVVTATRTALALYDSPSPLTVVTAADFELSNGTSAADVLRSTAGAFLRDRGPNGQLKNVSLRGLSSEHVLVLMNGTRMNSLQNGIVDLSLLPLDNIERIEVVRGGSSAFYGGDATGGVINIITRTPESGTHARAEISGGSFGFRRASAAAGAGVAGAGVSVGFMTERGNDDYSFNLRRSGGADTSMSLSNADFRRTLITLAGSADLTSSTHLDLSIQSVGARRGIPGEIAPPAPLSPARQEDDNVQTSIALRHTVPGGFALSLNGGWQYSWQTYNDPTWGIASRYRNNFWNLNPHAEFVATSWYRVMAGAEFGQGTLEGSDFQGRARRVQRALYLSNEFSMQNDGDLFDRMTVILTGRYDDVSDVTGEFSRKLGINLRIWRPSDLRIRGSIGSNFRVPTFNDMYFLGASNPLLKPERSNSAELGLVGSIEGNVNHRFEATRFFVDTRDRILFDLTLFIPVNIGHVESRGWELRYEGETKDRGIRWFADAAFTTALKKNESFPGDPAFDKQLPYVPESNGNLGISFHEDAVSFGFLQSLTSKRFASSPAVPSLPAFARTDVHASYEFGMAGLHTRFRAEVSNVFDTDYEVYKGYPMPGRAVRISASVDY